MEEPKKKRFRWSDAWREARELVWAHRHRLAIGLFLMLLSRLAGLVLPASSKYLIDDVIAGRRSDLLLWLALAVGGAAIVQALTSFALSQVLGVAAQRAITDMRIQVQRHILRLPVSFFDSTKTGILISRIMTDAEGIRNLVGTGIVQAVAGAWIDVAARVQTPLVGHTTPEGVVAIVDDRRRTASRGHQGGARGQQRHEGEKDRGSMGAHHRRSPPSCVSQRASESYPRGEREPPR